MPSLRQLAGAVLFAAVSLPVAAQAPVKFLEYTTNIPRGWEVVKPTSSMRLGQYTIRDMEGLASAEVVVYFFGVGQGGTVESNLARWKGQFSNPDHSPVYEKVSKEIGTPFPVTVSEYRGTYARGVGAGDAANARPGQSLVTVIAETPRGTLFFQLFGAISKVAEQREALVAMVRGLK
jgi:hypothetical protein